MSEIEKEEEKAIKILRNYYHIDVDKGLKDLIIKGKYKMINYRYEVEDREKRGDSFRRNGKEFKCCIGDDGFELLSKIKFIDLIKINLSCNRITSAKYLDNMVFPHLEYLDLSNNLIEDAKPIAFLESKYLKYILLQKNEIKTLKDFNHQIVKFEELEILRVDNNKLNIKDKEFIKAKEKFGKKLIYETMDIGSFNKKYGVNFYQNDLKLDLSDRKNEEVLIDIFNLITFQFQIKYLDLENNNLDDVSLLGNMPLFDLKVLVLSLNNITNILFLRQLSRKCKDLEELYLHDNSIVDITLFKDYFTVDSKLKILTLKHNPFYIKENKNKKEKVNDNKTIITIKDQQTKDVFVSIINRFKTDLWHLDNLIIKVA